MIAILIAIPLMVLWVTVGYPWFGRFLGYDVTSRPPATQPVVPVDSPDPTPVATTGSTTAPAGQPAEGQFHVTVASPDTPVNLGSAAPKDPTYRMGIALRSLGAGIDQVVLNEFKRSIRDDEPYVYQTPYPGQESRTRPLATRSVWIDGTEVNLADVGWVLESADERNATFNVTIARGGTPVVRVRKLIQLQPTDDPSKGYEVLVQHMLENLSPQPVKIRTRFNGTTLPPVEQEHGGDRQVLAGYAEPRGFVLITHNMAEEFTDLEEMVLSTDSSGNRNIWAGTSSIYFNALVRPLPKEQSSPVPGYISSVTASTVGVAGNRPQVVVLFDTVEETLAPNQTVAYSARAYFGPRKRALLNSSYFSAFPVGYDKTLVLTSGPCGFCTFNWLVDLLVKMLAGFHWLFGGFAGRGDWGLAIIALVVVVRVLLHPISKKSQIAMARMGKMAPEMERLKKKYGEDKEQLQKAMMELYKEQGVAPMLGCLPMLLQMPIWIALWQSLQTTFELRHAPFLWGWTWIDDLSQPDHLLHWTPFRFLFFTISGLNVLPILMGVVFYLQMKYQPKPATMTKEQEQQQKMMMWMMPFLFPLMLYSGPSGLNLYILTSTMIGIVESKKIRDHLKEQEEREKAGRVIVDAGKKFKGGGGREGGDSSRSATKPKKRAPGGLMGWLRNLQEKADQIKREAEKKR